MNLKKLAAAMAIAVTTTSVQFTAFAHDPVASGTGAVSVRSTVAGGIAVGTNGASTSFAQNSEAASASVSATATHNPRFTNVNAGISGATSTSSFGTAVNVTTGYGFGSAFSTGSADTSVAGSTAIHGVTGGFNGGYAGTHTDNVVIAGPNSGSYVAGQTVSGFDTQLSYSRSAGASLSAQSTGYASGANASGALEGMNAAGISNIGSSGSFFATGGLSATTGASAP
jgi:hypothetical protein